MSVERGAAGAWPTLLIAVWLLQGHALADTIPPRLAVQSTQITVAAFPDAEMAGPTIALASLSNSRFTEPDLQVLAAVDAPDASVRLWDGAPQDFSMPRASAYGVNSSPGGDSVLADLIDEAAFDGWLMLVVGAGLIAVQLRRKQRELRRPKLAV